MALDLKNISSKLDSLLDGKLSKLESKQKLLICVATCLLPCVAFFFLVYSPKREELAGLEGKKGSLEQEIQKLEKVASELGKHKAEMAEIERLFKEAALLLPEQKEIPSLLTNISEQGITSGLEFLSFKPAGEKPQEFYAEIPVDIAVYGSYHNVGVFLDRISKLPRIVAVNNIKMDSPKQVGTEMMLNSSFQLLTYRFVEPEPTPVDPKGAGEKTPPEKKP